ncbi:MAG TPA: hypothetical protein VFE88_00895 [Candidatus Nanoarchaeia archaeon]|nr:hypothetical protein [Candidatus Nanoarchaeia archaeon]
MLQRLKQKTLSLFGSASGGAGFLGSVPSSCHNLCTGFISLASLFGISLSGMPLAFLPAYSTYFWTAALLFLILMAFLHFKKHSVSRNALTLNLGLVLLGIPFFKSLKIFYWVLGGAVLLATLFFFIREKYARKLNITYLYK